MKLKRDTDTRLCSTTRRFRRLLPSPLVLHVRVLYSLQRVARTPSCREPTAVNLKLKLRCSTSVSLPIISTQNRGALGDIVCLGDERSVVSSREFFDRTSNLSVTESPVGSFDGWWLDE
eukprot:m.135580 g.135580  ORF g.135580 m.135580 type:complete len:119 (+) comp13907_c0_seq7:84-440(+)